MELLGRSFKYFACCNVLKVGAKGRTMLQETLPGVLDYRTFSRVKVDPSRCEVCMRRKAGA